MKTLTELRKEAAASPTGCIVVSIEQLNAIAERFAELCKTIEAVSEDERYPFGWESYETEIRP